jgi:biotin transporter BioY
MTKRLSKQLNSFKYKGEPIRITLGTLVLCCLCILTLIVATFTQIPIKHPAISSTGILFDKFVTYRYIPQIPMVFLIVALLGRRFGILVVIGYILLGMFFPIFALGGGISYIFEYGFGYLIAFIPVIFFAGTLLKAKSDFLRVVLLAILGVCSIHILGVLYMLFVAALRQAPMDLVMGWILSQSGVQVVYDIFFAIIAIYIGKLLRKLLWIVIC